jgi:hypothetical protein
VLPVHPLVRNQGCASGNGKYNLTDPFLFYAAVLLATSLAQKAKPADSFASAAGRATKQVCYPALLTANLVFSKIVNTTRAVPSMGMKS